VVACGGILSGKDFVVDVGGNGFEFGAAGFPPNGQPGASIALAASRRQLWGVVSRRSGSSGKPRQVPG